jgi:hypothetical protein
MRIRKLNRRGKKRLSGIILDFPFLFLFEFDIAFSGFSQSRVKEQHSVLIKIAQYSELRIRIM